MTKTQDLLDNSIISSELIDISADITEVSIDNLLDSGILKDLPIVTTLVGITKVGIAIKDRMFVKKVLFFLNELKTIPTNEKQDFIDKIINDKKYKTKVGETLMLIIDKLNDYSKTAYVGKLFAAAVKGQIDYDTFLKLSNIIDKCFVQDLNYLIPIYKRNFKDVDDTEKDILYNLGLLINMGISGKTYMYQDNEDVPDKKNKFEINKYGKLIVELLLINKKE